MPLQIKMLRGKSQNSNFLIILSKNETLNKILNKNETLEKNNNERKNS